MDGERERMLKMNLDVIPNINVQSKMIKRLGSNSFEID
jgi:hypothetical protein